ncbi:phosphotransferase [Umezawaea beigongshangensis]|uniref:phosphotransferase n=1 Tax=Umezawaea beigongshangensis TaxID=2780383 RepID=UPI0018F237CF|nr:phosphotransferase [Umezawaea beigongshangensis]
MTSGERSVARRELLAAGQEADVFLRPDGLLVKRDRAGRSLEKEARLMSYLRHHRVPVPRVAEVDGPELVMEYVPGPRMSEELDARPWRAAALGRELARVHRWLDEVPVPDFLPGAAGDGLLHLDLHPGNVVMGPDGPVVIDWAFAVRGDRRVDVALSWLAMAVSRLRPVRSAARWRLVGSFLREADHSVREAVAEAAEIRLSRHARTEEEREAVLTLVSRYTS